MHRSVLSRSSLFPRTPLRRRRRLRQMSPVPVRCRPPPRCHHGSGNRHHSWFPRDFDRLTSMMQTSFLNCCPGARDRDGLPDAIRFWKTRIDQLDRDATFAVGLIYGPSGCGKSSFVKAGLLPHLGQHVQAIYVEATADETESRLLHSLRKSVRMAGERPYSRTQLRHCDTVMGSTTTKKVVIVIDQFRTMVACPAGA